MSYVNFFLGSVTVSGALTGLLFVALSVAQGKDADSSQSLERQAVAGTAFTALVDSLWISLVALLPGKTPGGAIQAAGVILGLLGLTSTASLAYRLWRSRSGHKFSHKWPIALPLIMVMYAAQVVTSLTSAGGQQAQSAGAVFVLVFFGLGIARSWELLGLRGGGVLDLLASLPATKQQAEAEQLTDD